MFFRALWERAYPIIRKVGQARPRRKICKLCSSTEHDRRCGGGIWVILQLPLHEHEHTPTSQKAGHTSRCTS